ncbi:TPA: D-alanyl-lipoteichoic acid biosynthesis protein DltB [Streptococcus equi subsp. zooepidemicus]|uniref:Teichoic acid D-alanyltransferase n=1 Tax=Streptococcus equi subsp. zooepidemicus (strain H70) TaxID=553483 RepID=C0MDC8_STRS7|nr:D-alanyl-lipoteichoic acid biosynthesis protein DltB [Streptococcus equi]MCD3399226.1 D-alanyl-lipoteichoic acid biosynthesis protein DltB [Streptococcus equi subsp. zooepidemicus]MCD3465654.1 D-alanyl-lipoteichoic acid biosynthesis protein DltB [Streptococcus equi subsp. zooepidemicus]CAW98794.1 putative activated D-alanine transport protein [Streptococcus equi subsp. zooepidemicus]HEK9982836.1 D-alanyl-lipoteichoic acid biosynthesis protein DltB [Streptococcus equi subsp. zooepidemicus]HE
MTTLFHHIPYMEPYGNPIYFVYLIIAFLPVIIGIFKQRRFSTYESFVSLIFILLMFGGEHYQQLLAFLAYLIWQTISVLAYKHYRQKANAAWVFYLSILASLFPLICVKVSPFIAVSLTRSFFSFLGISYLTFKSVGMIIEMRDGVLTDFSLKDFLRFMIFFPTFSSGPIDRFRRFQEDYTKLPSRDVYLDMLNKAVMYLMLGFLYKHIISYCLGGLLLPLAENKALTVGGYFNKETIYVMYLYGLNLFFDFAGYSMFAIGLSYLLGIKTPENFNKPFLSPNLKEFWNRWHMSLSFWFRDFVFMRLVHLLIKHKAFKNRNVTSGFAYLINMLVMGLWHGLTWYYIAYGLFHGIGLIVNDAWLRKKKEINRRRKKQGLKPLFEGKVFHALSIVVTFHVVLFSLLLFSGFLNELWFSRPLR